jgi:hypothetical protein
VRRSLDAYRAVGRTEAIAIGLETLSYVELRSGRPAEAATAATECLALARTLGFREVMSSALVTLAAAVADTEPERAARLLGAAEAVAAASGEPFVPRLRALDEATAGRLRERLGGDGYAAAVSAGRETPPPELAAGP